MGIPMNIVLTFSIYLAKKVVKAKVNSQIKLMMSILGFELVCKMEWMIDKK